MTGKDTYPNCDFFGQEAGHIAVRRFPSCLTARCRLRRQKTAAVIVLLSCLNRFAPEVRSERFRFVRFQVNSQGEVVLKLRREQNVSICPIRRREERIDALAVAAACGRCSSASPAIFISCLYVFGWSCCAV